MGDIQSLKVMVSYLPITTFYQGNLFVRTGRKATGLILGTSQPGCRGDNNAAAGFILRL